MSSKHTTHNPQPTTLLKRILFAILFASCILYLTSVFNPAYAGFGVTNTAGLMFTDNRNSTYTSVFDTAAIEIIRGPQITFAKDVRNIRTGDVSPDMVAAYHGDTIEFILTIKNTGDDAAKNVTIIDSIPFGTIYDTGSALDTSSFDTSNLPPDTITFQHIADGTFDETDTGIITAIKWQWDRIDGVSGYNKRVVKFRVRVQ